jgi:hypothetical protein
MAYASGRHANAVCDICGRDCKYRDLRKHITNQKWDGLKVCPDCYDVDNPQLQVGRVRTADPQALYQARPNSGEYVGIRAFAGFNPVVGLGAQARLGQVTVTTS